MLSTQLATRSSAVAWLRVAAATSVVLFHCFALNRLWAHGPLATLLPGTDLGLLGVQIFFFLSGLLVAQSYVRHRSIGKFALARVLRLYPALIAATLFTVALGAWSSPLTLTAFVGHAETLAFAVRRSLGLVANDALPGAFMHNPFPFAVNGSLWTLPIEIKMYIAVAVTGLLGLLTRKWVLAAVVIGCVVLFAVAPAAYPITPDFRGTRSITLLFALGALSFAWRESISLSIPVAAGCVLILVLFEFARVNVVVSALLIGYVILTIAYHPLSQNRLPPLSADLSYGIYVYSFPIQQTLLERWNQAMVGRPWALFAAAMLVVVPIAALSWFMLEKPSLERKLR